MLKTVTENSVEVAATSRLRGFLDEYGDSSAEVLFLEGEIHSGTKPVSNRVCVEVAAPIVDKLRSSWVDMPKKNREQYDSPLQRSEIDLPLWFSRVCNVSGC